MCIAAVALTLRAGTGQDTETLSNSSNEGRVTEVVPGSAYVRGKEGKIVVVQTPGGPVHVFVLKDEIEVDELLIFSGPMATVANWTVVDSTEGSLYRPGGRTAQEQIQDLMRLQEEQEKQQPANTLIGDESLRALPTSIVETKEQKEERRTRAAEEERNRRVNLLLSIIGLVVGLLAIERLPSAVRSLFSALKAVIRTVRAMKVRAATARAKRRVVSRDPVEPRRRRNAVAPTET